jgi:hypothetical protein
LIIPEVENLDFNGLQYIRSGSRLSLDANNNLVLSNCFEGNTNSETSFSFEIEGLLSFMDSNLEDFTLVTIDEDGYAIEEMVITPRM